MWGAFFSSTSLIVYHISQYGKDVSQLYGPQARHKDILRPGKKYSQLSVSGGSASIINCGWKILKKKNKPRLFQKAKLKLSALATIYIEFMLALQLFT